MRSKNRPDGQKPMSFIEAARRGQIVACAIDTIADLGYSRASLAEVARRAHISKSVISYHFAGKDELISEVISEVYSVATSFMRPRIEAPPDAQSKLRAYIEGNVDFYRTHRSHILALVEVIAGLPPQPQGIATHVAGVEASLAILERILRQGQAAGQFREFSPRVMGLVIRAVLDALPPQMRVYPDLDLDTYARELVDIFDRATRAEPRAVTRPEAAETGESPGGGEDGAP
jgi:AcrR family transcriptional regulator